MKKKLLFPLKGFRASWIFNKFVYFENGVHYCILLDFRYEYIIVIFSLKFRQTGILAYLKFRLKSLYYSEIFWFRYFISGTSQNQFKITHRSEELIAILSSGSNISIRWQYLSLVDKFCSWSRNKNLAVGVKFLH